MSVVAKRVNKLAVTFGLLALLAAPVAFNTVDTDAGYARCWLWICW